MEIFRVLFPCFGKVGLARDEVTQAGEKLNMEIMWLQHMCATVGDDDIVSVKVSSNIFHSICLQKLHREHSDELHTKLIAIFT